MRHLRSAFVAWLLLVLLVPASLSAAQDRPLLHVGYMDVPDYISQGPDGYFRGYIYDYLQSVANYSGFRLKFVPGTPTESVERLLHGEIDMIAVLPDIEHPNPEIVKSRHAIIYAPIGLILRPEKSLDGDGPLRLGFPPNIYPAGEIVSSLRHYGFEQGRDYDLIPFDNPTSIVMKTMKGELDGYVDGVVYHRNPNPMVAHLFNGRFAIAMRARDTELRKRFDRAVEDLLLINPQIREQLYLKYFNNGTPLLLTSDEKAFIKNNPTVTVTLSPGQKPFSYFEDGKPKGIIAEIAELMAKDLGLSFQFREAANSGEVLDHLKSGEIDIVADYFSNYNWGQENNASLSQPYLTLNYVPVMRRDRPLGDSPIVACVRSHFYTHEFIAKRYPAENLRYYDTVRECMEAVNGGRADVTFLKAITVQHDIEQGSYLNLFTNGNVAFSHMISFAVSQQADPRLIRLLDKEIRHLGEARIDEIVTRHTFEGEQNRSLMAYIANHPWESIAVVAAVLFAIIGGLLYVMRLRQQSAKEIYRLAYHNQLNGLTNVLWFEREAPRIIRKRAKDRMAGRLFIMVLSTRRIDLLKASLDQEAVADGIRQLVEHARAENAWILADGISSVFTHLYVLGYLDHGMTLRDAAEKFAADTALLQSRGYSVRMEYNFGLRAIPADEEPDIIRLMADADTAQMEAMENGENIGIYDEKLQKKRLQQKEIESHMRQALRDGEFQVWLQPKYDLRTHKIVGAESLTRWQSPKLGFVMPGLFITLFEKNGFILEFDYHILETVCRMQRQRLDQGLPVVPLSINQSGLHIREPGYLDRLQKIVDRYQLPPGTIDLEITETAFVDFDTQEGRENSAAIIAAIKKMGFTISMDDFCTGYSSIAMLQHLDMDVMKIDRAMLLAAEASSRGKSILHQVVALGESLHMQVLCEGVETEAQEALLLESGCFYAQGYLFAKPMPAKDYFAFADSHA